jgi:FKBP-type peptidyl-prolyl cis-trans isomerase FklB
MKLDSPAQKVSYLIGRQVGDQLKGSQFPGFEIDGVVQGIKDSMSNAEMPLAQDEIEAAYEVIQGEMQKMEAELSAKAREAGDLFLAANAKKEGIVVLESGLQYEVMTAGTGAQPTRESTVRTHYHGTFTDGRVFDSSVERGEPTEFPVGGVIAGWTEALQLMTEGSKWRLFVPSDLAYGEQGSQGAIPPHSALVFEVELIKVVS